MFVVAGFAILTAIQVRYAGVVAPLWLLAIPVLSAFCGLWILDRGSRPLAAISFFGLTASANALYVMASICPDYMLGPALTLLWAVVLLPLVVPTGLAWANLATRDGAIPRRSPRFAWALVAVLAIMPIVTLNTSWPLRLAFLAARSSLDRLADDTATGRSFKGPVRIGPFQIADVAYDPSCGAVGVFVDPNPNGRTGFVRTGGKAKQAQRFLLLIGTDTNIELGWGWSYRQDD